MSRPKVNPETASLLCKTCNMPFNVKWQKRNIQKYCCRSCANKDPEVLSKMIQSQKETSLLKYGVEHPMQKESVVENFKISMKAKYGKEFAQQVKSINDKSKHTNMLNYGVECVLQKDSPLREKIIESWIEKYGVDNPGKSREVIERRSKVKQENHYEKLCLYFSEQQIEWLIKPEEYDGYHFSKRYNFKCKKCNTGFDSTVYVPTDVFCELCHPEKKITAETSLHDFLSTELNGKTISRHNRIVLEGKELDFYIPELNFAIEYNGLYWHREGQVRMSKNYHLDKTMKCTDKNIRLIHIFENEWKHKTNIVKSIIRQSIGSSMVKIYGRECEIRKVDKKTKREFLNTCHIQGDDRCSVAYGLYYKNSLVSLMTFCKSRFDKKIEWEISRFCNSLNTRILGGASKLFSIFLADYKPKSVVSYSDRRFFTGDIYSKLGMEFAGNTAQGYHYVSPDFSTLFNRQMFQKSKLKNKLQKFDESLSEWENMKANGFDRIWDCGHSKWVWIDKTSLGTFKVSQ